MKAKTLCSLLVVITVFLSCFACADNKKPDLKECTVEEVMQAFSICVKQNENSVDVDADTLHDFWDTCASMKIRLPGMVTEVDKSGSTLFPYITHLSCKLVCGEKEVSVFFEDKNESIAEGEYIEIVGNLLSLHDGWSKNASFSINDAQIVERGKSVREQLENKSASNTKKGRKNTTKEYKIEDVMSIFPDKIEDVHSIVDVDIVVLNEFFLTCKSMKMTLCGVATEYESEANPLNPELIVTRCYLIFGDKKVYVSFENEKEVVEEGEYIKIKGELSSLPLSADDAFSVADAIIIERGASAE